MKVYLDNAATTALRKEVLEEMMPYLTEAYGNPSSIHAWGRKTRAAIEKARKQLTRSLNASTSEIFFTSSGTEANNTAIKNAVRDLGLKRIISSPTEHHCVLHTVERMGREGIEVIMLEVDLLGRPDYLQLESLLKNTAVPTLVSLMHANNETGTLLDLERVAALCKAYGAYLHTDTVQTIAHYPFDLQSLPVHFLSGSAHKFHGPKGSGFLFIRSGVGIGPFIDGGSQERNMRAGTENVAGIVGLGKAIELAYADLEVDRRHISSLKSRLQKGLTDRIPGLQFNGDQENALYTVLNVSFPGDLANEMLLFNLDINGIAASGGSACTSGSDVGSHVLKAMGSDPSRRNVRFSFSRYTTESEIEFVLEQLSLILLPEPKSVSLA
jgi:cysteine desulfurase